jgi:hypothetical protein
LGGLGKVPIGQETAQKSMDCHAQVIPNVRRQESVVADVLESAADGAVAGKRSNDDEDATGRPNYLYFAAYGNQAR